MFYYVVSRLRRLTTDHTEVQGMIREVWSPLQDLVVDDNRILKSHR